MQIWFYGGLKAPPYGFVCKTHKRIKLLFDGVFVGKYPTVIATNREDLAS